MDKILIALDFGPSAEIVATSGKELANAMNAKIVLLHIVSDIAYYSSPEYGPIMGFTGFNNVSAIEAAEHLKDLAKDYLDRSKKFLDDDTIETVVEEGNAADVILQ